jgi:hypothetical protein
MDADEIEVEENGALLGGFINDSSTTEAFRRIHRGDSSIERAKLRKHLGTFGSQNWMLDEI